MTRTFISISIRILVSAATTLLFWHASFAQDHSLGDSDYSDWIVCAPGYKGAVAWHEQSGHGFESLIGYPDNANDNVHVQLSEPRENDSPAHENARDVSIRLCAMKVAFFSREGENVTDDRRPTDLGHVVVFDQNEDILRVSEVLDMSALAQKYGSYVLGQETQ